MPRPDGHERTRKILMLAVALWLASMTAIFLGMRTRLKPVLIVGLVGGLLALVVTQFWLRAGSSRRP